MNYLGGYKNALTFILAGMDIEEKAQAVLEGFWEHVGGKEQFEETRVTLRRGGEGASEAFALLTLGARDPEERKVGRRFWNAAIEMGLVVPPIRINTPRGVSATVHPQ